MAQTSRYVVLYFMQGPMPSAEQVEEARLLGPHVKFRNVLYHNGGLEPCSAVAGDAPQDYLSAYPKAVSYLDWLQGKLPVVAAPEALDIEEGGTSAKPLGDRILDADAPPRKRRSAAAQPAGMVPLPGLTGTTGAIELPPPPVDDVSPPDGPAAPPVPPPVP